MNAENRIQALVGDITEADTEAIVNAANTEFWMGSGVAGAIKRAGGAEVEREAVAKGPVELGDAVSSTAGNLPHKRVIHAAAMGYEGGSMIPANADSVREATLATLRIADEEGLTSLAFPALGTGVGGFSIDECAAVMAGATAEYLAQHQSPIERVVFVLRNDEARQAFESAIAGAEGAA